MSKHTPQPWKARGNEIHAHGGIVAEVNTIEERGIADARLIAAAPELLAACYAALERLSFANPDQQPASNPAVFIDQSTFKQVRGAIQKATTP